jgi:hypothetical protein
MKADLRHLPCPMAWHQLFSNKLFPFSPTEQRIGSLTLRGVEGLVQAQARARAVGPVNAAMINRA